MSALYTIKYHGVAGDGHGTLYIGRGVLLGVGVDDNRYNGGYSQHGANLVGQATLTAMKPTTLVTGRHLRAGEQVAINFTLPPTFSDGRPVSVTVDRNEVSVSFNKIGDIP